MRGDIQVEIEWMPSHLEEKESINRKNKYIREGGLEQHIDGNVQADVLAKKGAEEHSVCDVRVHLAEQRKNLTMLVQSMMVDIWTAETQFRFPSDPEKAISSEDAQDREQMLHLFHDDPSNDLRDAVERAINTEEDLDDFFGNVDINGDDVAAIPHSPPVPVPPSTIASETNHNSSTTSAKGDNPHRPKQTPFINNATIAELVTTESADIRRLFPSYVYEETGNDLDNLAPAKPFNFSSPPKPSIKIQYQSGDFFLVPFDASWWDSLEWFFISLNSNGPRSASNTPQ